MRTQGAARRRDGARPGQGRERATRGFSPRTGLPTVARQPWPSASSPTNRLSTGRSSATTKPMSRRSSSSSRSWASSRPGCLRSRRRVGCRSQGVRGLGVGGHRRFPVLVLVLDHVFARAVGAGLQDRREQPLRAQAPALQMRRDGQGRADCQSGHAVSGRAAEIPPAAISCRAGIPDHLEALGNTLGDRVPVLCIEMLLPAAMVGAKAGRFPYGASVPIPARPGT